MPKADGNSLNSEQLMHAMSVDDGYRVERVLAKGAGGVTELVTIDGSGPFVRKKIPREQARRAVWAALAECESRYLPKVWATYEMPERFAVVLDFVAGETLESHVSKRGVLGEREACDLIGNICEAAGELHRHGVIHRDISPVNIIVSADGAHVIDLGISRIGGKGVTRDTAPFGTTGFAAPEQYGFSETDARSDVYSIGKVLGYMLTGISPKDGGFDAAIADDARLSDAMRDIVWKACAFEPSARFQTAEEMAQALRSARGEAFDGRPAGAAPLACGIETAAAVAEDADDSAPMATSASSPDPAPLAATVTTSASASTPAAPVSAPMPMTAVGNAPACGPTASAASFEESRSHPTNNRFKNRLRVAALAVAALLAALASIAGIALVLHAGGLIHLPWDGQRDDAGANASAADAVVANPESGDASSFSGSPFAHLLNGMNANEQSENGATSDGLLAIVESGWYVDSQGYVCYAFALRNGSDASKVDFPSVEITGRDASGAVLFTNTQVLNAILPGETLYYGGLAGNGGDEAPATVEFTPMDPDEWNVSAYDGAANSFVISGLTERDDGLGATVFTGEVAAKSIGYSGAGGGTGFACVSVVLRDDAGRLVYGCSTFIDMPAEGERAPFEVPSFGLDLPPHATAEAYAQIW